MFHGMDVRKFRSVDYPINPIFLNRWSPRSLSGEAVEDHELMPLFEAARWAPSSYNGQPWRFLYALRDDQEWETFVDLMGEFNQSWAGKGAALVVVISRKTFEHNDKPAQTHSFDTGAAWQSLALQAAENGLVAHGMQGFDYEKAKRVLEIPDDYSVEAMVAIGRPGKLEDLPEKMREREKPSDRKPLREIIMRGRFRSE